jgi:membrane-bound lytic murein transglycosylase D
MASEDRSMLDVVPRAGRLSVCLMAALLLLSACAPQRPPARSPRAAPLPERIGTAGVLLGEAVRPARPDLLGSASYDLPVEANSWVEAELNFLLRDRRDVVDRWIHRGDFYEGFVKSIFREQGIPTDLYHLAMIESGFIPTARSPAGAAGMWQFMPATSRDVSLRVDALVDERLDPVRSTRAAARHLRSLYRVHGDWALAAAAYNAGSTRVLRSLERYAARNFWDLASRGDLAPETRHYVPRLFAITIIGRNRERFGFSPPRVDEGFAFDSVHVDQSLSLSELAAMAGVPEARLVSLNPHLFSGTTPADGYWVWVPAGSGVQAQRSYIAAAQRRGRGVGTYTVRWGDTLSGLARLSGLTSASIRELNPRVDFDRLQAGATINLPASAAEALSSRSTSESTAEAPTEAGSPTALAMSVPTRSPAAPDTHQVAEGESLWRIARRYGVSIEAIQQANSIDGAVIRPGQRLTIPSGSSAEAAGTPDVEHVVAAGDTLWGIARRYGSSVEAIQAANSLGERPIRPGQRLSVPATRR